jgi:hypothetical protein
MTSTDQTILRNKEKDSINFEPNVQFHSSWIAVLPTETDHLRKKRIEVTSCRYLEIYIYRFYFKHSYGEQLILKVIPHEYRL